jgi:DNA-binding MarR family transcriptional regulator
VARYDQMMRRLIATHAPEFTEVGITMAQAKVLYLVLAAGRLRMSELAARLGTGPSSASEVVDRLVELELLDRAVDPADRRQVVVTVTGAGTALLEHFRELNERQLRALLVRLEPDELDAVLSAIDVLDRAIDRSSTDLGEPTT